MRRRSTFRRRVFHAPTAAGFLGGTLVVLALATFGSMVFAGLALAPDSIAARTSPALMVRGTSAGDDYSVPVQVTVHTDGVPVLMSPIDTGTVTGTPVEAGDIVGYGSPIVEVDGVMRLYVPSPKPFYRDLGPGDSGPDVAMLVQALSDLGLYSGKVTDSYDRSVGTAVWALATRIGVGESQQWRSWRDGSFSVDWFVWSRVPSGEVRSMFAEVGSPAPATGTALAYLQPSVTGVEIGLGGTQVPGAGESVLEIGLAKVEVSATGAVGPLSPEALEQLKPLVAARLDQIEGDVPPRDLEFTGSQRFRMPAGAQWVPISAVVNVSSGSICSWMAGPDGTFLAREITVVASDAARSRVLVVGLEPSWDVLANPLDVVPVLSCEDFRAQQE